MHEISWGKYILKKKAAKNSLDLKNQKKPNLFPSKKLMFYPYDNLSWINVEIIQFCERILNEKRNKTKTNNKKRRK